MKHARLLAVSLLVLMLAATVPVQEARAQTPYTESFHAYVAGSDALWWVTFGGVNGSSKLSGIEGVHGLLSYNITAIKTTGWGSGFEVFGPEGYNLLPVPFVPPEGIFLNVGADNYSTASAAASAAGSYFLTTFVSYSNGTDSYTFYSSIAFNTIISDTLMGLVPRSAGGLALLFPTKTFVTLQSPFVVFGGVKTPSGFVHTMTLGSITSAALSSKNVPDVLAYFDTSNGTLTASKHSTSTTFNIRFLDGRVSSNDTGAAVVNSKQFTGDYSVALAPGKELHGMNATVLQSPVELLATRVVDQGALAPGDNLSVSITLTNLSNATAIDKIHLTDSWWVGKGFKLVSGNSTISIASLAKGTSTTPTYVLQYVGNSTGTFTIPREKVTFDYYVNGYPHSGVAKLNPIALSLGEAGPALYAYLTPVSGAAGSVGQNVSANVVIRNIGSQTASSVTLNGKQLGGIVAGSSTTVKLSLAAPSLTEVNVTKSYEVGYKNLAGTSLNASTNVVYFVFSHSSMKLGLPLVGVNATVTSGASQGGANLTLGFYVDNKGTANVTTITATVPLPAGLGCGVVSGSGLTCKSGVATLTYSSLAASGSKAASMEYNLTSPVNYVIAPIAYSWTSGGYSLLGTGGGVVAPSGFVLTKSFVHDQLYSGMETQVTVSAANAGPYDVYNATVGTRADSFDKVPTDATQSVSGAVVKPAGELNFTYSATATTTYGTATAAPITGTFYFGGVQYSVSFLGPKVTVYEPPVAAISTLPANPEEGKKFTLTVTIDNPSGTTVSNVSLTLSLPSGVSVSDLVNATLSKGILSIYAPSLGPQKTYVAKVSVVAGSGTFSLKGASSFVFEGVTVQGGAPSGKISVGQDVTTRYLIPIGAVGIVMLAVAFYVRKMAEPISPSSPK